MRTEAQRKADRKYETEGRRKTTILQCRIDSEIAEKFKAAVKDNGSNVNSEISKFIIGYLGQN